MKQWRPDNWEEDKFYRCTDLTEGGGTYRDIYEVFEAGADAILEAIKREGWYMERYKGWVILIPAFDLSGINF